MQSEAEPALLTSLGPFYRLTEQPAPDEPTKGSPFGLVPETWKTLVKLNVASALVLPPLICAIPVDAGLEDG